MKFLQSAFAGSGLVPVASGSAGATLGGVGDLGGAADIKPGEIKLEPGSSIAIPLLTGDLDLSAIGTVTEVYNGHVYAFGHAMEAEGPSRLPIATGYIYTIMPTLQQSFKMGSSFQPAGALVTDEQTGIVGLLGLKPNYVPLNISVTSRQWPATPAIPLSISGAPEIYAGDSGRGIAGIIDGAGKDAQGFHDPHHRAGEI